MASARRWPSMEVDPLAVLLRQWCAEIDSEDFRHVKSLHRAALRWAAHQRRQPASIDGWRSSVTLGNSKPASVDTEVNSQAEERR